MQTLRQRLGRLAGAVLSLHLCLMAAVPTTLYLELRTASTDCTCPQGGGGACPMHHRVTSSNQSPTCAFRSASDPRAQVVATLLGPVAVLASTVIVDYRMPSVPVTLAESGSFDSLSVPDSPPPRG